MQRGGVPRQLGRATLVMMLKSTDVGKLALTQPPPVVAKLLALPGDDGVWLDEEQLLAPPGPHSGQVAPEDAVSRSDAGPPVGSLVDGELMAQGEYFELERYPRAEEGCQEQANEKEQKGAHGGLVKGACPPIIPADLSVRNYSGYQ